jgi:hypothetical protein
VEIEAAVLGNVSATWTANRYLSVAGYVRNVADHQYVVKNVVDESILPPFDHLYRQTLNAPRTYGVVLNVSF